jgi:hypothetical protein
MIHSSGVRHAQSETTRGGLPIRTSCIRQFNSRGYMALCRLPPESITDQ